MSGGVNVLPHLQYANLVGGCGVLGEFPGVLGEFPVAHEISSRLFIELVGKVENEASLSAADTPPSGGG